MAEPAPPSFPRDDLTRLLLAEGREVLIATAGLSMGHTIRSGESVVIRKVPPDRIRFGDIVVFRRDDAWVCHRVLHRRRDGAGIVFRTKGDPMAGFDEPVAYADVLGKVVRIKWPEGDFSTETPGGRTANVAAGLVSLAAGALYRVFPFKGVASRWSHGGVTWRLYRLMSFPSRILRSLAGRRPR